MPTTLLTPVSKGKARPVGASLWRRQLLPLGEINYDGRKIRFDRDYLAGLVKAFAAKAYDAVPFQFADAENKHTNKPEQRRGTVKALELTDDGLDVLVEADPDAAKYLGKYPDLGISASIVEAAERADGRFFPAAIKHVLGTLDPRITGMRQWQSVEASNPALDLWGQCADFTADEGEVINLTSYDYAAPDAAVQPADAPQQPAQTPEPAGPAPIKEEPSMALTTEQEARLAKLLDLPQDKFDALLTAKPAEPEKPEAGTEGDGEDELTDEQIEALMLEDVPDDASEITEGELEPAGAEMSQEARDAIELANSRAEQTDAELRRIRAELDQATYQRERDTYVRQGVPADLVDLAQPLLLGSGRTVELANGKSADAGAITRKLLTEFAGRMKALGLDIELGNAEGADDTAKAEETARAERDRVKAQMAGLGHR